MPVPKLGPGSYSALGAHKPMSICAQGCWDTHQRVTPCKAQQETYLGVLQQKPSTLNKTRLLCQGCTNSKDSTHPSRASLTDRNDRQGKEQSHCCTLRSSEMALSSRLWIAPLLTAYLLEHTTIQPTAQKYTLMGALTSTNSCL